MRFIGLDLFTDLLLESQQLHFIILLFWRSLWLAVLMIIGRFIERENRYAYWIFRFVLAAFISYIIVYIGQMVLKNHKKLLRYIGFV